MNYLSVSDIAKKWGLSDRTVRQYCKDGKIKDAFLTGKTWNIPENAVRPITYCNNLINVFKKEKECKLKGGIYHKTQILLAYNSNHIEGSKLTEEQTRLIYETNTIGPNGNQTILVDDIVEAKNHFNCFDYIIDNVNKKLTEKFIKELHLILKSCTSYASNGYKVGEYKTLENEVGGKHTCPVKDVSIEIKKLLENYNKIEEVSLEDIIEYHKRFECIHPFQDGNGRVGRLIMFKECLKNNIVPFIINDELKFYYYNGLTNWDTDRKFLVDTVLTAQDKYKTYLDYFKIRY